MMPSPHRRPTAAPALVGMVLLLSACVTAEAVPPIPPAPPPTSAALGIVDRLAATGGLVPDLVGLDSGGAADRLGALGATAQVLAFAETSTVTAQYPQAGAALPADRLVTLWVGAPPAPPPPPAPSEPRQTARSAGRTGPAAPSRPEGPAGFTAAPGPADAPDTRSAVPAPGAFASPGPWVAAGGDQATVPGPPESGTVHNRVNIRTVAPAPPGTILQGPATWYGEDFAGRGTACGGIFDPDELTLATRELRCGTRVRVTGPSGATVEAVATDWGPAEWTGRRFDLSAAAFAAIAHPGVGVMPVTIETL